MDEATAELKSQIKPTMLESDKKIGDQRMELLDKMQTVNAEVITYRFTVNEETMKKVPLRFTRLQQILPTICASLSCLPFGLMLGWPSPTNPILLDECSPIPITIDQSAMIAGFLMIGNAVGTPFSDIGCYGSKYGIIIGNGLMASGWVLMWQSENIFWLLGSRFLVGLGNAYGTGQLKIYISNTCDEDLKSNFIKMINMYVFFGIILMFSFGPFIDFRDTSITCLIISVVIFSVLLILPTTPAELIQADKIKDAKKAVARLKQNVNINNEIYKISQSIKNVEEDFGLFALLKGPVLRVKFLIFVVLVFCQQFSGAPSTLIYTQILFQESHCPYPEYLAIAYVIVFFICNIIGIFLMPRYNKRNVLLYSTIFLILVIVAKILVIHFKVNEYWSYSSVVVMFLYIIAHTLGLGNIPITLIPDMFPSPYRKTITHFFIAFHSILALLITKIFQVLMSQYNVGVPFYLYLGISIFSMFWIYFALRNANPNANVIVHNVENETKTNSENVF